MPVKKKGRGAPIGTVNNPVGKNQHVGDRGKAIAFRLPIDLDTGFRETLATKGVTVTEAMVEAVKLWLAENSSI